MSADVGKSAKRMGKAHPRNVKKTDREPIRYGKKSKPQRYGITVEYNYWLTKDWERITYSWHATEKARDQALDTLRRKIVADGFHSRWYRFPLPVNRS